MSAGGKDLLDDLPLTTSHKTQGFELDPHLQAGLLEHDHTKSREDLADQGACYVRSVCWRSPIPIVVHAEDARGRSQG